MIYENVEQTLIKTKIAEIKRATYFAEITIQKAEKYLREDNLDPLAC